MMTDESTPISKRIGTQRGGMRQTVQTLVGPRAAAVHSPLYVEQNPARRPPNDRRDEAMRIFVDLIRETGLSPGVLLPSERSAIAVAQSKSRSAEQKPSED